MNYIEMNCADCRSIDDIRDIIDQMRLSAWGGGNRIWVLDEVVQLPTATQQAMLKMLEDTPKHVYFFLLTSDKSKLLDTIVGRCFPVFLHAFKPETIEAMVKSIAAKEGNKDLSKRVASKIAIQADGSARMALQLLESCLTQPTEKQQLDSIEEAVEETVAFDLAKAVMYKKEWKIVSSILQRLKDNPETARRVALKYAETVLLGDSDIKQKLKASALINVFRYDLSESGRPGLTDICWRVCCGKSQ
jgi:DNA polymerase III gamma/tau subunit